MTGKDNEITDADENTTGDRLIQLTSCPFCGSDLTAKRSRAENA